MNATRCRFLVPALSKDAELCALQVRLVRKRRLNAAADLAFRILTLGMLPQYRLCLFPPEHDLKAVAAREAEIFHAMIRRRKAAAEPPLEDAEPSPVDVQ